LGKHPNRGKIEHIAGGRRTAAPFFGHMAGADDAT